MTYLNHDDVPQRDVAMAIDYLSAVSMLARGRTAVRIASWIADECLLKGESRISHKEFQRRAGVCRRTVQLAIRSLVRLGIVRRSGTTDAGIAIYSARWEIGAEWRARAAERAHGAA